MTVFCILLCTSSVSSQSQGHAPDGSFHICHGRYAMGHVKDFKALQQQILEGGALLRKMEATLYSLSASKEFSLHQVQHHR